MVSISSEVLPAFSIMLMRLLRRGVGSHFSYQSSLQNDGADGCWESVYIRSLILEKEVLGLSVFVQGGSDFLDINSIVLVHGLVKNNGHGHVGGSSFMFNNVENKSPFISDQGMCSQIHATVRNRLICQNRGPLGFHYV